VGEVKGRLVLVELDDDLAMDLRTRFQGNPRVDVLHKDILATRIADVVPRPEELEVVGNIPYNITSPILFHILGRPRPRGILLMVQREVADRILAEPGTRKYGALSVGVRTVAHVEKVLSVTRSAFRPQPTVDSMVIRIRPFSPVPLDELEESRLRNLTRALFQWRRKQLGKILRDHPDLGLPSETIERALAAASATPQDRPETLSPSGFITLARAIAD
jgi:16S rRNA (adenine1518-N6/adenine1519-N6)-dimethyltransferase